MLEMWKNLFIIYLLSVHSYANGEKSISAPVLTNVISTWDFFVFIVFYVHFANVIGIKHYLQISSC